MNPIALVWIVIMAMRWANRRNQPDGAPAAPAFSSEGRLLIQILLHLLLILFLSGGLAVFVGDRIEAVGPDDKDLRALLELAGAALAFPAAIWMIYFGPHWLAWRILGPAGFPRLAGWVLFLGSHGRSAHRAGARALLGAAFGRPPRLPDGRFTNAWTALSLAVAAERRGEPAEAEAFLTPLFALPPEAKLPFRLRTYGLEIAARQAASRGDWAAVARRAAAARGRGARLLRLLARAHEAAPPTRFRLGLAWALAAGRREAREWVRAAEAAAPIAVAEPAAETRETPAPAPFLAHLELLGAAATGRSVPAARVVALAQSWEAHLTPRDQARLEARALALGSRGPTEAAWALRHALLTDLELLAADAAGDWPEVEDGSLAGEIVRQGCERLFAELSFWTAGFPKDGSIARPLEPPLDEWRSWVRLRAAVERLAALGGLAAMHEAWYGGLRLTACNWPVHLARAHGAAAQWACYTMHLWSAELARTLDDETIATRSAENAQIARTALAA